MRLSRLAALPALVALLAGGWLLLRDAGVVRVRDVYVTGIASSEEREVRAALEDAAREMTTLHVREDVLERAVARFPSVAGIEADARLPHTLLVEVRERRPVATLDAGSHRVAVTADGRLLRGLRTGPLPRVEVRAVPARARVKESRTLAALSVAATAPPALRVRVERIGAGNRGLTLELRDGPAVVFGSDARARAKWAATARVLAEPGAAGASYLDVRIPERVAAGGLAPIATPPAQSLPLPEGG